MRDSWLRRQPPSLKAYLASVICVACVLAAIPLWRSHWSVDVLVHASGWSVLCLFTAAVIRWSEVGRPFGFVTATVQGVWALTALMIWGLEEAVVVFAVSELVSAYQRWKVTPEPFSPAILSVLSVVAALSCASVVLSQGTSWYVPIAAGLTFVVVDTALVVPAVCMQTRRSPLYYLWSWPFLMVLMTEVLVSVGMAAAWRSAPVAAIGLAWAVLACELSVQHMRLRQLAVTDPRTGLMSPQVWQDAVQRLVSRDSVAIVMADLDHFKTVNDLHGHLVGDEVLTVVGELIRRNLRSQDLACRWGGEEFLIALPATSAHGASVVAERIRTVVDGADVPVHVTLSLGVSLAESTVFERAPAELGRAIGSADEALYQAKSEGRNRVRVVSSRSTGSDASAVQPPT